MYKYSHTCEETNIDKCREKIIYEYNMIAKHDIRGATELVLSRTWGRERRDI